MSNEELRKKIVNVFETSPMASFATIRDGRPWVRYVMVHLKDSLEIFFTSPQDVQKGGPDPQKFSLPHYCGWRSEGFHEALCAGGGQG